MTSVVTASLSSLMLCNDVTQQPRPYLPHSNSLNNLCGLRHLADVYTLTTHTRTTAVLQQYCLPVDNAYIMSLSHLVERIQRYDGAGEAM